MFIECKLKRLSSLRRSESREVIRASINIRLLRSQRVVWLRPGPRCGFCEFLKISLSLGAPFRQGTCATRCAGEQVRFLNACLPAPFRESTCVPRRVGGQVRFLNGYDCKDSAGLIIA